MIVGHAIIGLNPADFVQSGFRPILIEAMRKGGLALPPLLRYPARSQAHPA
jgi:hypothetical protein